MKNLKFEFPNKEQLSRIASVDSREILHRHLKDWFSEDFPNLPFPFQIFLKKFSKGDKIVAYCRHCKAKLAFHRGEGCWDMT